MIYPEKSKLNNVRKTLLKVQGLLLRWKLKTTAHICLSR
jgi:hypothetical protein